MGICLSCDPLFDTTNLIELTDCISLNDIRYI